MNEGAAYGVTITEVPNVEVNSARRPYVVPRRYVLAGMGTVVGAAALGALKDKDAYGLSQIGARSKSRLSAHLTSTTNAMYIVAHADDTLLFQSPDLIQSVQSGDNVLTVHLTAGDNGEGEGYWGEREEGIEASYALMAGVANKWTTSVLTVGTHQMVLETLTAKTNITVVFMRLPDGGYPLGLGTPLYNNQSLMQLWNGTETSITAVDGSTTYTLTDLINTLAAMMTSFQPQIIATQDFVNTFGDGDHMDHYATAFLTQSAHQLYSTPHNLIGYEGYPTYNSATNVSGAILATKQSIFYAYGAFDPQTCSSATTCATTDYALWLPRQYIVGTEEKGVVANAGPAQTVPSGATVTLNGSLSSNEGSGTLTYAWTQTNGTTVTLSSATAEKPTFTAPTGPASLVFSLIVSNGTEVSPASTVTITVGGVSSNVAPLATATASSQSTSTGQLASAAIDGVISGYPSDTTAEWATNGGGVGSWLLLTWSSSYTISSVVLFDRPNTDDQITSGTLAFSDGTIVSFGSLPNAGTTGLTVNLATPVATTTLLMTVTGVSTTTLNIGLSEIQAFGIATVIQTGDTPIASAGTAQTVASGAPVTLDGSGSSDPKNLALTYDWTQTGGAVVTLSSASAEKPTFTAPEGPAVLTFSLTVSNGTATSAPSMVTVTVASAGGASTNVAPLATATASSQSTSTGQLASAAIDGVISGYPSDTTAEWATNGGGVGSWLLLTWSSPYLIDSVELFDRPNADDQITSGTLTFSNGTVLDFGSLPNDGDTGLTVTPTAPIITTSLLMTVTGVSSSTLNVGLSEIEAFGSASTTPPSGVPTASAGPAQTVASGALVTLDGSASSDPNKLALTYAWTQTGGPTVTLSSASAEKPTFTSPAGPASLVFSLTVSNGTQTSTPSTVAITVSAPVGATNVAPLATATASSQNASTGQLASSAIDGVISGYPSDVTAEWATVGGGVGSYLELTWAKSYVIDSVVLFDRPNSDDQITSGTLQFSNGTILSFGALPNDGATGLTVTPPSPVTTTSILMTVTGVSATTLNVGLSEIQAYGTSS